MEREFLSLKRGEMKEVVNVISNACLNIEMELDNYIADDHISDDVVLANVSRILNESVQLVGLVLGYDIEIDMDELYTDIPDEGYGAWY